MVDRERGHTCHLYIDKSLIDVEPVVNLKEPVSRLIYGANGVPSTEPISRHVSCSKQAKLFTSLQGDRAVTLLGSHIAVAAGRLPRAGL